MSAVSIHSRLRMATNLLPLIRRAPALRRVISVFAGTKEGKLYIDDLRGRNVPLLDTRGHSAALMTLSLEALARKAPEVSFVHNFPGSVDTDLVRAETGFILLVLWQMFKLVRWTAFMPFEECGERHAYLCVSGMYPSKGGEEGVSLEKGLSVAKGADGKPASGVYSIDGEGESAPESVVSTLQKYRSDGYVGKVWEYIEGEFKRITGSAAVEL